MRNDGIRMRQATTADWPAISRLFVDAVHGTCDAEVTERDGRLFEPARSIVATDGGIVGHTGSFARSLQLPGADVPAAHVALVAVAPAHRRRGLLTRLLTRQLADARAAGEPLAVLWASQGRVYRRFGFGLASVRWALDVDTPEPLLPSSPAPEGHLRDADPGHVAPALRAVYDRVRPARPGWSSRSEAWWRERTLADPAARRRAATPWRAVVHQGSDGADDGYALWRVHQRWETSGASGRVEVREVVTGSPDAYLALWRFLLGLDLTRSLAYPLAAPDEPLVHLVTEPRRLSAHVADALWVRITDLPAALAGRRYAAPIDVVLDVSDPLLPGNHGRWRLTGDPSGARCEPTTAAPELVCDVADLAAALLGDGALAPLADAGRVSELRPGALVAAHRAFGWHRRPSAIEMF